jgi:integrase
MPKTTHRLTAIKAQSLKKPGFHADGAGLYLKVHEGGSRSWVYRFMRNGKARYLGLGSAGSVSLALARSLAAEARQQLQQGQDPIETRRQAKKEALLADARVMTFRQCGEAYIASHESSWKNAKHCEQWRSTLKRYLYPIFGDVPASAVTTDKVLEALQPLWSTMPETASRVRGRIEAILDWAKVRGARDGENPARWRGHLANLLPKPSKVAPVQHYPALPFNEVPRFLTELRTFGGPAALALELVILTATRTNEVLGARWSEFEPVQNLWAIPPERTKTGKEHRIALSPRVQAILKEIGEVKRSDFIFPGQKPGRPLSNMALLMLLRRMKRADITVHGFRSSFRDWAAEATNFPNFVVEMALGHAVGGKVESAYRRGDLFEKRRRLMTAWAAYCDQNTVKVVPMIMKIRRQEMSEFNGLTIRRYWRRKSAR